jgi:hypothetical protein
MKSFSLSKKPAIKRLFGTKSKRSSKNGNGGILKSSSENVMEIEFENDDSGDNISDGDAESLQCAGFPRMTSMAKNGLIV